MDVDERDEGGKVFEEFIREMETFARPLGLYLQTANGARMAIEKEVIVGTDPIVKPLVAATFIVGDEAWSDRVQHPELHSDTAIIASIEHATHMSEAERIRERFLTTGKIFEDDDDDD